MKQHTEVARSSDHPPGPKDQREEVGWAFEPRNMKGRPVVLRDGAQ